MPQAAGTRAFTKAPAPRWRAPPPTWTTFPRCKGTLYAAPILSTVAHGRLLGVDAAAALALPGVRDVILARDIPGDPMLAQFRRTTSRSLRTDTVQHVGQVIGVVVADSVMQARRAARQVQCSTSTPCPPS